MGFLSRAVAGSGSSKALGPMDIFRDMLGRSTSFSGKTVNEKTALEVATVFACLRVRANGLAQVPLKLMQEAADGKTRLPAKNHPLFKLLKNRPNDWQTSFEYRETLSFHLDLCGNHYSFVSRSNRSGIMELIPFEPGSVTVKRDEDWNLTYDVRADNGRVQTFPAKAIWHVRGPSWNSWMGLEAVRLAREAIGLAMSAEEQQARMQKNGVKASGVYAVDAPLGDEQYKRLKKWIDENHAGSGNAGKAMLLDRGAKWLNTSMTGVDAQTLETRRFQVEEICRHFGVNPIMVFAESKNTTYASAEQMFLSHVVHTLSPTYTRIEQSIDANLLTDKDLEDGIYACFIDEGLLRGLPKDKKDIILGYVNGGVMYPNEGRALLDMNPDPDPASDKLRIPANITGTVPESKQMDDIESKVTELKSIVNARPAPAQSFSVTLNQEPVNLKYEGGPTHVTVPTTVNVPEQKVAPITIQNDVHVPEGAVPIVNNSINVPQQAAPVINNEVHVPAQAAPVVNNTVNIPPQKAPVINNAVHVPQQQAPVVNNTVHVPELKAPNVTFEATLPPLTVIAQLPARKTHTETKVTRDKNGNINGSVTDGTEKDA